jgi:hypothetical protein
MVGKFGWIVGFACDGIDEDGYGFCGRLDCGLKSGLPDNLPIYIHLRRPSELGDIVMD